LPFRDAHEVVGKVVHHCTEHKIGLEDLDAPTLATFSPLLQQNTEAALAVLTVQSCVAARTSHGGTAPNAVRQQLQTARERFENQAS
jgi:argininosuccinate lyase